MSDPSGGPGADPPALPDMPTEVVTHRVQYPAPPPPYAALKPVSMESAELPGKSITITIKCPSCLGLLANRELKTIAPVGTLVVSAIQLFFLIVAPDSYYGTHAKASSIAAVVISLVASLLVILKPINIPCLSIYGPFATFVGVCIITTMQACNVVLSFYLTGARYWYIWPCIVNGILSLIASAMSGACAIKTLKAARLGTNDLSLLPAVSPTDAVQRTVYWKECMIVSFIGVVALIDYDGGQYVLFAFMLCILAVSTVFTFPSKMIPKDLGSFCDVAPVELGLAASLIALSVVNIVDASFILGRGWLSANMRIELLVQLMLIACAHRVLCHILRHVSGAGYEEAGHGGNLVRNMTAAAVQGEKKPVHTQLV